MLPSKQTTHSFYVAKETLIFFTVVSLIIIISGCEDDAINDAQSRLGKIEGLLKPADAATEIRLMQAGNIVATTYPDENGKYIFPNLEFGATTSLLLQKDTVSHLKSTPSHLTKKSQSRISNLFH